MIDSVMDNWIKMNEVREKIWYEETLKWLAEQGVPEHHREHNSFNLDSGSLVLNTLTDESTLVYDTQIHSDEAEVWLCQSLIDAEEAALKVLDLKAEDCYDDYRREMV
tara:strand:+ start:1689 stop:2012 length:324 start_codon:yes stop_codon:yes gene_type:complete